MDSKSLSKFTKIETDPLTKVRRSRVLSIARELVRIMKSVEPTDKIDALAHPFSEFVRRRLESDDLANKNKSRYRMAGNAAKIKRKSDTEFEIDILRHLLKQKESFGSLNKAKNDLRVAHRLHRDGMHSFDNNMKYAEEKRYKLNEKVSQFKERKKIYRTLIDENINKIDRQKKNFTESRLIQIAARGTLTELIKATKESSDRCAYFTKQITGLKATEKFVLEVIRLLPPDYLKNSVDPVRSLMLRYQSLTQTQKSLIEDFATRQQKFQKEMEKIDKKVIETTVGIFLKEGEIHHLGLENEQAAEKFQNDDESKERLKTNVIKELRDFHCIVQSIRNITRKAGDMLVRLQYRDFIDTDIEAMSISECFKLLQFLLSVIFGIQRLVSEDRNKRRLSRRYLHI